MSEELMIKIERLQVENEVNKIMFHSLQQTLLYHKNEQIDECIEHIEFVSNIVENQIKDSWSLGESKYFRQLIDAEIKKFSLIYAPKNE